MYYCKHCNHQIFPIRNLGKIPTLKGKEIHINPKMYCSKECFVTKNIFTRRYEVFDYEEPKSYERRIGNVELVFLTLNLLLIFLIIF